MYLRNYPDGYVDYDKPEKVCYECQEKDQMLDESSEYLEEVIHQLYGKGPINYSNLEYCLDQLCHYLKVKTIPGDLRISRKLDEFKIVCPRWLNEIEQDYKNTLTA